MVKIGELHRAIAGKGTSLLKVVISWSFEGGIELTIGECACAGCYELRQTKGRLIPEESVTLREQRGSQWVLWNRACRMDNYMQRYEHMKNCSH